MNPRPTSRSASLGLATLAAAFSLVAGVSRADVSTDQCIGANTKAQYLRQAGKFTEARDQLKICAQATCPRMVRDDCTQWLDEVDRAQPTIVFNVKDAAGNDLGAVSVKVDGRPLVDRLDGTAVGVDAGEHAFTFEAAGQAVTRTFMLKEGERGRAERIVIGGAPNATAIVSTPREEGGPPPWKPVGLAAAGVGVVGLGIGIAFGVVASDKKSNAGCDSNSVCPTDSAASALRDAKSAANVSTAFFVVGAVLAAAGLSLWLFAPGGSVQAAATADPQGAGFALRGAF